MVASEFRFFHIGSLFLFLTKRYKGRMFIYCFYTPSHEVLFKRFFAPSIPKAFELIAKSFKHQLCPTAAFAQIGWRETQLQKILFWIEAIKKNWQEIIVCSDVDAQFFEISPSLLVSTLGDKDIAFQWNGGYEALCSGFFICKANQSTLDLFERIKNRLIKDTMCRGEQLVLNQILGTLLDNKKLKLENRLRSIHSDWTILPTTSHYLLSSIKKGYFKFYKKSQLPIRWAVLPHRLFWLPAHSYNSLDELTPPPSIIFHHANWTVGTINKLKQLAFVKERMRTGTTLIQKSKEYSQKDIRSLK